MKQQHSQKTKDNKEKVLFTTLIGAVIRKIMHKHTKLFCITLIFFLNASGICFAQAGEYPPNSTSVIPTLNFKDADIRDVLHSISMEYETNIVTDNKVNSRITTTLFNITVFNAVKMIAEDNNFEFTYDSQRFYIKPKIIIPPPESEPIMEYFQGKINLDLQDVEINKFLEMLRKKTKKNFLLMAGTSGKLTGKLSNISFNTGLKNILQNNGFYYTEKDSIYYVSRSSYYSSLESKNSGSSNYWVNARSGKVTIDVRQANLGQIIDDLFNQLELQVNKLADPTTIVTIKINNVSIDQALNYLFRGTEFTFKRDGDIYVIGNKGSKNLENNKMLKLKYLRAEKVKENIPPFLVETVSVSVSLEHNAIVLSGSNENISAIEDYIKEIDTPVAQVMIEALVVDYNLNTMYQLGITAGRGDSLSVSRPDRWYPGFDVTASGQKINKVLNDIGNLKIFGSEVNVANLGKLPDDFYVNLKALEQKGIANVKSRPLLSTINGHTASLKIGTVQNYVFTEIVPIVNAVNSTFIEKETIQKIEATISFEITPWVGPDNELTLEIKPDFETPVGPFSPDKKLIPAINKRSLFSTVRLRDGETIVLGGLIQETETNTEDKVPLLGDIPFLGELFKTVDKRKGKGELIIYLTPKIYYGD